MRIEDVKEGMIVRATKKSFIPETWGQFCAEYPDQRGTVTTVDSSQLPHLVIINGYYYFTPDDLEPLTPDPARSGHPEFYRLLDIMADIHSKKNKDYGNGNPLGNFMDAAGLGVTPFKGVLVRMSDKWARIRSLVNKDGVGAVVDESIEDTLIDLANYAILAVVIRRETQGNLSIK